MKKVLIVDDDKAMTEVLAMKLQKDGFDVKTAFDGQEASEIVAKHGFDLIILDLILPKLNGFNFLEKFRNSGNQTPVAVISNLGQEEDRQRVESLGIVRFFSKSDTHLTEIVDFVKEFLV